MNRNNSAAPTTPHNSMATAKIPSTTNDGRDSIDNFNGLSVSTFGTIDNSINDSSNRNNNNDDDDNDDDNDDGNGDEGYKSVHSTKAVPKVT